MSAIIDDDGFRLNVGIIIASPEGRLFWGRRVGNRDAWQFPQGGMMPEETPEETLYRELHEEVGLRPEHVSIVGCTSGWLKYRLPRRFLRRKTQGKRCIGQRQKWFLLKLEAEESCIDLTATDSPEFVDWRWVSYWYPIRKVVPFKRGVYLRALKELHPALKDMRAPPAGGDHA